MSTSNIESIYPLSPMQHGMLFHCLYAPESEVYFDQFTCTLDGGLDVEAFTRAWQKVVDRHPVLRTSFIWERREKPLQVVQRRVKLQLAQHDWREFEKSQQQERLEQLIQADRARGFDLSRAPLMRQILIRLSDDVYQFIWSRSHLLLDGWSNPLILRDVFAYYDAYRQGKALELAAPRPYQDYIHWLQRQDVGQAERFWRPVLAGFRAPTPLGVDRTLALPVKDEQGVGDQRLVLSTEIGAALQALTRKHQLTLNTVAQGMWALLLSRYSGEDDVLFGGIVSGRPAELAGCETMVGLFINTLPVRVKVPADTRVLPWLRKLQEAQVEARQYEYSPLVQIQAWSEMPRGVPLFESILAFENYPLSPATEQGNGNGLQIGHALTTERTNYPLTLMMTVGAQLSLRILYQRARFEGVAISRMLEHMQILLEGISAGPEQKLSELPLLSPGERERLLIEFNETRVAYPADRYVHEMFEEQVERSPEAMAVVFGEESLSYGELNGRANQLAHYLRKEGVGPEVLVGICAERSLELVVGLLAILKAGGAYVPIDPTYPRQRLSYLMEDTGVGLVLGQQELLNRVPASEVRQIFLDALPAAVAEESRENPRHNVEAENLAYVIYTSGSTGQPKGVMNTHGGIANRLQWMQEEYQLTAADRVLQKTPFSFDVSVWEFLWPLIVGARLVVARPGGHQDRDYLKELIAKEQVTTVHFVPSMLEVYLEDGERQGNGTLKLVFCSGEALSYKLQQRFMAQEQAELHNLYGPTEAAIDVTYWRCGGAGEPGKVPIGWPIANTQIYILDKRRELAPEGVAGEIYIGGQGLGRGYYGRPGLTAERFVANPFSEVPGARMYQTGDLGRFLAGGEIEFLGRVDYQVKIRGYRIELGEIEAVLQQHGAVQQAVVVAQAAPSGGQRLVAYVAGERGSVSTGQLRSYLTETLPDYMVPAVFVWLDALPLTPNGKVDRRALPPADPHGTQSEVGYIAPGNAIEELIAGIWCKVLGVERVGALDNFFELGGHSLLATQIISRLREALQAEVALRLLFETPNLRELARSIEASLLNEQGLQAPPIQIISRDMALPLSFPQQRLWFLDQMSPGNNSYNIAAPVRLRGSLNTRALELALTEIVRRHEILRTNFPTVNGEPRQVIRESTVLEVPLIVLDGTSVDEREDEARRLAQAETGHAFDLARDPLLRVCLLRFDEHDHLLLLTMHHIITDGWSMGVLIREMALLYDAFQRNEASPLPELPFQYADFAHWQREWLQGDVLRTRVDYWKKQLDGAPAILELPTDRVRPPLQTTNGATHSTVLPQRLSSSMSELSRNADATLFMTLLAAFQTLLCRYTNQQDIVVGTPIANRTRRETEDLIGFFVNTLVLMTDLSGNPSFRVLLRRIREVALQAYVHQDLPFEKLVEELKPERTLSHMPLFQVLIAFQNAPEPKLTLPALELQDFSLAGQTAKFDLSLYIGESNEGLRLTFEYNTDLFNPSTIEQLARHFETLLAGIVANPDQRINDLPLLDETERHRLLVEWTDTTCDYPFRCIHEVFAEQAAATPEAVALISGDQQLTFAELDQRANQLAHYLQKRGVGPEVIVAVCMPRSIEMVIALLGILKAGGAFVPVDSTYAAERVTFLLKDSRAPIVLTQQRVSDSLAFSVSEPICVDTRWAEIAAESRQPPACSATPDNAAYLIYTSGSTGRPKGSISPHHASLNRLAWMWRTYPFEPGEVCCQKTSLSFGDSIWENFGPLLRGIQLVIIPDDAVKDPRELVARLGAQDVTRIVLVPSLLRMLLEQEVSLAQKLPRLKYWTCSGESLPLELAQSFKKELPAAVLINLYGSSEIAADVTCYEVTEPDRLAGIPIGRPIDNTKAYILDGSFAPVPLGVCGELYIAGAGLARGYFDHPDLTAERFLANPFSSEPGARMFRTGDLARYRPDGTIEFVGRADYQVKIRGFRVELGEIEAALGQHQTVRQGVVVLHEHASGDKRLVAYIVPFAGGTVDHKQLRAFVQRQLPEYMVPSVFITLDEMPLTSSKKIDRRALPAPEPVRQGNDDAAAPRDGVELQLTRIWEDVLSVRPVGVQDNFFNLGGHSFLAVSLMSRIEREFGVKLPLTVLFQGATVEALGLVLRQQVGAPITSSLVKIQPNGSRPPLFCAHPAGGNVICYMELARHLSPEQPVYGFQARGLNNEAEPLSRIEEMAAHYLEEIRTVQPGGPYYLLGWSLGGLLAFEMACRLHERGERVALVALLDTPIHDPSAESREVDQAEMLLAAIGEPQPELLEHLRTLQPDAQLQYVVDWAHRVNALPPDWGLIQVCHLFNMFKINVFAGLNYVPKIYPGQVTLFRAEEQLAKEPHKPLLGWDKYAVGGVEMHVVPGNHFNMAYRPHVRVLSEQLTISLDKAQAEDAPGM
jgi:amino acid adenylation domain-containing protein